MAKKKKKYSEMSREEIVTGKVLEKAPSLDRDSREYHAKHGWPKEKK